MTPRPRRSRPPRFRLAAAAMFAALSLAAPASATWSIILINTRTGEVAAGSATCLTGFDLQANTPVLITGIGAATAQSFVDTGGFNRVFIRDRLLTGLAPADILLALPSYDPTHQTRQYGLCDTRLNGRCATFTGTSAGAWAGGLTGRVLASGHLGADIVYAIQGNVLTGAPVVAMAEAAVISTPGDLAARLMAGMEAARLMGGDGRCSCTSGNPTGCGSPPATFTKSAHIAYMLIARTGDRDGCNQIYRTQSSPVCLVAADLNADGHPELIGANSGSASITVMANISTGPGQGAFAPSIHYPGFTTPRDVIAAEVTGDAAVDVIIAVQTQDRVSILPGQLDPMGQPTGLLGAPIHLPAGDGTYGLAAADFDGDNITDIAACNLTDDTLTIFRGLGAGAFAPAMSITVLDGPTTIDVADLDGDNDIDIVLASGLAAGVQVIRNTTPDGGLLAFSVEAPIASTGTSIAQVKIGDLNGDTVPDFAVASGSSGSLIAIINYAGVYVPQSLPFGPVPGGVAIADVDGDGITDLIGVTRQTTNSRIGVLRGLGGGTFAAAPLLAALPNTPSRIDLADIDLDGDLDLAVAIQTSATGMVISNVRGPSIFNDGVGCATGDYFMEFNIANQSAAAPDPVFQLQTQYDAWRTALIAKPDAEQSSAQFSPPRAPLGAAGPCLQTLTIQLRDWQGDDLAAAPGTVSCSHAPGSAARAAISAPTIHPDGTVTFDIESPWPLPADLGADQFAVRIEPIGPTSPTNRAVTLMPFSRLARTPHADFDLDGQRTVQDIFAFLTTWFAAGPGADFDDSGTSEVADIFQFLTVWFATT